MQTNVNEEAARELRTFAHKLPHPWCMALLDKISSIYGPEKDAGVVENLKLIYDQQTPSNVPEGVKVWQPA